MKEKSKYFLDGSQDIQDLKRTGNQEAHISHKSCYPV
jgi:hypothetical protein